MNDTKLNPNSGNTQDDDEVEINELLKEVKEVTEEIDETNT